jgi:CubicO group peptidase (beta-lactamase class C family)
LNTDAIQKVLDNAVASGEAPGVAAAVSDADGTLFEAVAGVTALGGTQKIDADSLFWIASMTKPVTSLAVMQLVERGLLALDAPVGDLLPELKNPRILEGGKLRPAARPITLRHLLTHTAGFSYAFASAEYAAYLAAQPNPPAFGTRAALDAPLLFEPGERWEYGLGVDWAGLAVEAASGLNLEAYFRKYIFGPLGMADTSFLPAPEQLARRAALHKRQADGRLEATPPAPLTVPEVFSGGGGLYSTLRDYQKFLRVFLQHGAGIVTPGTVTEMSRNHIGGLRAGYLPSANPALLVGADVNPG